MEAQPRDPLVYSIKQAGTVSTLSRAALYRLIRSGELKVHKVGRRTLIPADSLHALIAGEA
ncbi:helix-turn-helix domain-containing protein [Tsuneonella sp. CC-YZS046]|uniref:helix-turn-helix domain-containing protein n=1 Tax=Tsuneonella sp. CC-YZS046 TaxID=3042152 RepID=UPI002D7741F0|nr:helix-turn-helix domain-containing protein [Tsuneonella sp. CC-YZS046]WRO65419.1 helix-turn-helix domain-containing protein [Tsuneonella sp. CC-YZS046]